MEEKGINLQWRITRAFDALNVLNLGRILREG
jgi:hypothetical protein